MSRWQWLIAQLTRQLWFRASLLGALGVIAALLAAVVERYFPWEMPGRIGADAVDSILTILASSMLAVTTFSLSIMVSAYGAATNNVTPRATRLLVEDRVTHAVLSTFIGSFLFGMVGLIVLRTGAYGERGRFILFVVTVAVVALVVIQLLRWINHITRLGRVGETTDRVEGAARAALEQRLDEPYLGGIALRDRDAVPDTAAPVISDRIGYIQNIDMPALSRFCTENGARVFVNLTPGSFVYPHTCLARVDCGTATEEATASAIQDAFTIGDERSFDQDPRFGLAVMSEIGSRALSPATNDPGTAIDVIGRTTRLLALWSRGRDAAAEPPRYPGVHVPPLETADLFEDAFMLMARDGAGLIEVQLRIQKSLLGLSRMGDVAFGAAALHQSQMAMERAEAALVLEADKRRLRELVRKLADRVEG